MTRPMTPCPKPKRVVKKARQPLRAKKSMRGRSKRSRKSKGHLFLRGVDEVYRAWIRAQPCVILGRRFESAAGYIVGGAHECDTPIQACHVKSRGAGGPDRANVVSLCARSHDYQHMVGLRRFQTRYGVELKAEAEKLWARYQAEVGATPTQEHLS